MRDLCEANNILLAPNGDDFSMVKESERESNDLSCLTYNLEDKMILRQFEEAAAPARYLCLFLQDKKYTWSYVLFTIWVIVVGRLDMYRTKVLLYRTMVLLARPTKVRR